MLKATLVKALTLAALIGAPLAIAPATASAAPTTMAFQIPIVWNPGVFGICGALYYCAKTPVVVTGEAPGTVTLPVFIPNGNGTYFMHWRNLGTGAVGVATVPHAESASLYTGAGPVILSMTMGNEIIAGTGVFLVP